MLGKLFENLYLKVFVNIIVDRSRSTIYIELCNKTGILESYEESFDTTKINKRMYAFISPYIEESPFNYISVLDTSTSQGAVPTCSSKEMSRFFDVSSSNHKPYNKQWSYYTSKVDLSILQNNYKSIGLDYVFSPFVVLANFFKDKIDSAVAMYLLIEDKSISISIFENSELLYAENLSIEYDVDSDELMMEDDTAELDLDIDGVIDLDEVDVAEDIDMLDDFGDIEDLSDFEEIDEFSETEDMDFAQSPSTGNDNLEESGGLNEDFQRFSLIQTSLNDFYKDARFNAKFIESAYIADSVRVSPDLKKYLEEELYLSVYVRNIDLAVEVCEIAKAESL